ncbi:MAG: response regulator [Bacteroidales bacterium]|nr:response regulator [Bacteroidales bacterium]
MIWIATEDGLNRYDGVKMTIYRHDLHNPNSLASDYVKQLIEDRDGNLFINSYSGVQMYRRATDNFSSIENYPPNVNASFLALGKDSMLYTISPKPYLVRVNDTDNQLRFDSLNWSLPTHKSGHVQQNEHGNLWMYREGVAEEYAIPGGSRLSRIPLPKDDDGGQRIMLSDANKGIYFADKNALYKVEHNKLIPLIEHGQIGDASIISVLYIDEDQLLIGTDGNGLFCLDPARGIIHQDSTHLGSLNIASPKVHRLLKDDEDNLWMGLYQQGIILSSSKEPLFNLLSNNPEGALLGSGAILSMCPDIMNGGYWVGTDGDGLFHVDSTGKHWTARQELKAPSIINALFEDSQGGLWLGSYDSPCYYLRAGGKAFEPVNKIFNLTNPTPRVFALAEDAEQQLWLATMGNGLFCYNLATQQRVSLNTEGMNPWQNCLARTSSGYMLVGTYGGIYAFNTRNPQSPPIHVCDQRIVYSIVEDAHQRLWAGTSAGLVGFSLQNDSLTCYTTTDGLPSNAVYAIQTWKEDLLWFSTSEGLACLNTTTGECHPEDANVELLSNNFSKGASLQLTDGRLWFGGSFGITSFSPNRLETYLPKQTPRITALYANNSVVTAQTETRGKPVLEKAVYEADFCTFSRDDNSFSIELGLTDYFPPAQVFFSYKINDSEWQELPAGQNLVNFSQLHPGRHRFTYAANMGRSHSEEKTFVIEIRHPWWLTPWAVICYIVAFVGLVLLFFNWWHSQTKMRLMSLVSHKIRTPLSLIVSPLNEMIAQETDPDRKKQYELMLRNAYRMQSLADRVTKVAPLAPIESEVEQSNEETNDLSEESRTYHAHEILIVEDDVEMRNYLIEQLSTEFKVRVANNGKEALKLVFEKQPNAIVSDVTMPEMDGITLCKQLKKNIHLSHIPVALLTARADEKSILQGLGIGADAYVTKPFNISILKQTLHNLIVLRTQLKNLYQGHQLQEKHLEKIEVESYDNRVMERIMQVVNKELSNPELNADMLCDQVGISRAQLYRKMKEMTNQSVSNFIRNVRLKQAEQLLQNPDVRISEIALKVGFKDAQYFNKAFKEVYGIAPKQWRDNLAGKCN